MMTLFHWEKLSPTEFHQLQEYMTYANNKLKDVLAEFTEDGNSGQHKQDEAIDFGRFCQFINMYLVNVPEDLCRHLFLSFLKKTGKTGPAPMLNPISEMSSSTLVLENEASQVVKQPGNVDNGRRSLSQKSITSILNNSEAAEPWLRQPFMEKGRSLLRRRSTDVRTGLISLKDVVCCLSLLEAGRPEDKLEFMFHLYDSDGNGILDASLMGFLLKGVFIAVRLRMMDQLKQQQLAYVTAAISSEIECIINQMMTVAEYSGWDVSELKPILQEMMQEIDYDSDGTVSLEEWKRGGLTNIPLLVLLGMDSVSNQTLTDEGTHLWRLKHFNRPAYCNLCLSLLLGVGKQGLCCTFCKYIVHERCASRAPAHCITTYCKSRKVSHPMSHHWVEGNCAGKCDRCKKFIKAYNRVTGRRCRWCKTTLHNRCASQVSPDCDFGLFREHILSPIHVCPAVLGRRRRGPLDLGNAEQGTGEEAAQEPGASNQGTRDQGGAGELEGTEAAGGDKQPLHETASGSGSLQIIPSADSIPLLVFVNPKSGGKQGTRILRKFQYLLNPRQVYNVMSDGGFFPGLQFFKDLPRFRILCCGGDGTVGWLLESMDKMNFIDRSPVAVLPLGTGNDLARCLRWGGGYDGENLKKILHHISNSTVVMMDRWQIEFSSTEDAEGELDPIPCNIINSYFSIGVDASIAHRFHLMRERHPEKFNSRMKNKLWYFEFGTSETLSATCKNLHENIDIMCDGVALDFSSGPSLEGIALLNIPSIYGGSNLWGDTPRLKKRKKTSQSSKDRDRECSSGSMSSNDLSLTLQDVGDHLIEVVGLMNSIHVAQVKGGIQAGRRLAQCSSVVIRTRRRFPMQIDGEPWMQPPCTIAITHKNQVPMLMAPHASKKLSFFGFFRKQ